MKMQEIVNIYAKNDNNLIYRVASHEQYGSQSMCYTYNLELVAGYDYINPDENDIRGYVKADKFIDDVQLEYLTVYPMEETLRERLEEEGYTILKSLPKIY